MEGILVVIILILLGMIFFSNKKEKKVYREALERNAVLADRVLELERDLQQTFLVLDKEKTKHKSYESATKSRDVRFGFAAETLLPILSGCPYEPSNMHFLGKPVDYLVLDYENAEVIFLEVKTNKAKESNRQKMIKKAIQLGKVYYEVARIDENGLSIKREKNIDVEETDEQT